MPRLLYTESLVGRGWREKTTVLQGSDWPRCNPSKSVCSRDNPFYLEATCWGSIYVGYFPTSGIHSHHHNASFHSDLEPFYQLLVFAIGTIRICWLWKKSTLLALQKKRRSMTPQTPNITGDTVSTITQEKMVRRFPASNCFFLCAHRRTRDVGLAYEGRGLEINHQEPRF